MRHRCVVLGLVAWSNFRGEPFVRCEPSVLAPWLTGSIRSIASAPMQVPLDRLDAQPPAIQGLPAPRQVRPPSARAGCARTFSETERLLFALVLPQRRLRLQLQYIPAPAAPIRVTKRMGLVSTQETVRIAATRTRVMGTPTTASAMRAMCFDIPMSRPT